MKPKQIDQALTQLRRDRRECPRCFVEHPADRFSGDGPIAMCLDCVLDGWVGFFRYNQWFSLPEEKLQSARERVGFAEHLKNPKGHLTNA